MRSWIICSLALAACLQLQVEAKHVPAYLTEDKVGAGVVKTAIRKLHEPEVRRGIFTKEKNFFFQWAKIATTFGRKANLKKGGIWALTFTQHQSIKASKDRKVRKMIRRLKNRIGINYRKLSYGDLRVPYNSLIGARLFLAAARTKKGIPGSLKKQGLIWDEYVDVGNPDGGKAVTQEFTLARGAIYKIKKVGPWVSKKAAEAVRKVKFFKPDHGFLDNIARVMTWYGKTKGTFKKGYHGGIWAVSEENFQRTKDVTNYPRLIPKIKGIRRTFGIAWEIVDWSALRRPFYSALAARLLIETFPGPIPEDVWSQSYYWGRHYAAEGKKQDFYNIVTKSRSGPNICQPAPDVTDGRLFCYDLLGDSGQQYMLMKDDVTLTEVCATLEGVDADEIHTKVASLFNYKKETNNANIAVTYDEVTYNGKTIPITSTHEHEWDDTNGQTLSLKVNRGRVTLIDNKGKIETVIRRNVKRGVLAFRVLEHDKNLKSAEGIMGGVARETSISSSNPIMGNFYGTWSREGHEPFDLLKKNRDYRLEHHVNTYELYGDIFEENIVA